MKILFFLPSLAKGGAERVTVALANHWAGQGWSVQIVTLVPVGADSYLLHPSVRRASLDLAGSSLGLWTAMTANWRRVIALRRLMQQETPDVAVAMMSTSSVLLAVAGADMPGIVRVGAERVHPPRHPLSPPWEWARGACYRWLDLVVAQTELTRVWLLANTSVRRVAVIPNPVVWPLPADRPEKSPSMVGRPGRRRLLAVGRLETQKGFDLLIDAFGQVAPRFLEWELVIVGEGPARPALEAQITSSGIADRIALAGSVGNLGDWYSSADAFVLSSRYEGFPNALAEAMAYGLPVVSVDCETGPSDLIESGINGLLVAAADPKALEAGLARIMADQGLRDAIGSQARDVRERFSLNRVAARWEATLLADGA